MTARLLSALLGLMLILVNPGMAAWASPPASSESSEESRHRTITSSETYMPLPPLTATVQANRRARGILQIEAGLEIEDPRIRHRVERYMPRLRNAYVSALSIYTGMHYSFGDVPDADRIAQILQEATDMTLGQEGADVLIGMIIIHAD
ncbi:flagellar basal body-associated FliL family protein [Maricaulis maris]|uniref:flagellar basal body-associated FliL family protein n=1 Tax=Maricaulis maris TaxID=74318 RepID=UPI003BAB76F0